MTLIKINHRFYQGFFYLLLFLLLTHQNFCLTIYFSINAFLYNLYIFTDKQFQLLILLKSSMTYIVLIGDDAVAQSISLILSREGKKRKTLPSFFLSLQYTHKMFFLIFPSFQVSLVYRRKKTHNMDR